MPLNRGKKKEEKKRNRARGRAIHGLVVGGASALLISLLYLAGAFKDFERMSADWRRTSFVQEPASSGIVNVTISQYCLESMQADFDISWPWSREIYGGIVDYLREMGARNILFDMVFSEFSRQGVLDDRLFIEEIKKQSAVYFSVSFMNSAKQKRRMRRLRTDIPIQLGPGFLEAMLKRTKSSDDRKLLKASYIVTKNRPGTVLKKGIGARTRSRVNSILINAGYPTKSLKAIIEEIKKADPLDQFKLKVSSVKGALPSYGNIQSPPYDEYLPVIAGIGNVFFEEDPDGIARRKVLLFRHYMRYFPDLSLAVVNSIFRTTNIYKTDRQIVLVRDDAEIDTDIFENRLMQANAKESTEALKKLYFPVPSRFLSRSQLSNVLAEAQNGKTTAALIKKLYEGKEWIDQKDETRRRKSYLLREPVDAVAAASVAPLFRKFGITPYAWRLRTGLSAKEQQKKKKLLAAVGFRREIRIPVDSEGKVLIKFYGSFMERSQLPIPRKISSSQGKQLKKKLKASDWTSLKEYFRFRKDGSMRRKRKLTPQEQRLVRFFLHRGGMLKRFSMSIRAYDLITAASRPEYMQTLKLHPGMFRNKTIIIGAIAPGLMDLRANPFDTKDPGFYLYSSMIENILNEDFLKESYNPLMTIGIILILCLLTALAGTNLTVLRGVIVTLVISSGYGLMTVLVYTRFSTLIEMATVELALVLTFIAGTIVNYFNENKQRHFIQGAFSQILAPSILDKLMEDPSTLALGGEEKELTIFFSDLQGFTSLSEELGSPKQLVEILNAYLTAMSDIILKYDGYVDKYEGDAIMAFWGAPLDDPDHSWKACYAALENQMRMNELQAYFRGMGLTTDLKVRIGMNTGVALVGMMGSIKKLNYSIIGDSVNLASRLEGANKQYGTYTMISETTYLEAKDRIRARPLDLIRVRGKKLPTSVYELMAKKGELDQTGQNLLEVFSAGIEAYRKRNFQNAISCFEKGRQIAPEDGPARLYLDRCRQYLTNPPADDWDGVFTMSSK